VEIDSGAVRHRQERLQLPGRAAPRWIVRCPCLSLCSPRNQFLDVDIRMRSVCTVIAQDCAIAGEQRGIWLVGTKHGHPREVVLREQSQGRTHRCIAEWPYGARLKPRPFSDSEHVR